MNTDRTEFTPILRTGQMLSFDWVCGELDEAGIPYQCREESSGGIQMAMPAFPSVMPGTWWTVLVPSSLRQRAQVFNDNYSSPLATIKIPHLR